MLRIEEGGMETSECSSGCESGWTMYLDKSYEKESALPFRKAGFEEEEEEEDETDLSMVSDASSGPPHLHEDDDYCCFHSSENVSLCPATSPASAAAAMLKSGGKRRRVEKGRRQQQKQEEDASFLDDTASSPLFGFSKTSYLTTTSSNQPALEFSYGFSATHYENLQGNFTLQKQLGLWKPTSAAKPVESQVYRGVGGKKKTW